MRRFQTIFAFSFCALLPTFLPVVSAAQRPQRAFSARPHNGRASLQSRFTATQRAQIARELAQNAARAGADAAKSAPVLATRGTPEAARQQDHQTHLAILLNKKYDRQTCAKYKITYGEMVTINREAIDAGLKQK